MSSKKFVATILLTCVGLLVIFMIILFDIDPLIGFTVLVTILMFVLLTFIKHLGLTALCLLLDGFGNVVNTERRNELAWGLGFSFVPEDDPATTSVIMTYHPSIVPGRSRYKLTFNLQYRVPTLLVKRTKLQFTTTDSQGRPVLGGYAYEIISRRDDVKQWLKMGDGGEFLDSIRGLDRVGSKGRKVRFVFSRKFNTPSEGRTLVLKMRQFITALERQNIISPQ